MTTLPVIAWPRRAPPESLRAALEGSARLVSTLDGGATILVLWGDSDEEAARTALAATPPPRLLVVCEDPPPARVRERWQRLGAEQVVALAHADTILLEWLTLPLPTVEPQDDPDSFESSATRVSPFQAEPPASATISVRVDGLDPFPPMRVPDLTAPPYGAIQAYITALERYLEGREELTAAMGVDGLSRYLEVAHLREQVPASQSENRIRLDPYGRGPGGGTMDWPVLVRRLRSRGEEIELSEGRIVSIGTDGLVLVSLFAAGPRQRLLVDLPLDDLHNVQLICEARWQRRLGLRKWQLGALLLEMRRRRLHPGTRS